MTDLYCLLTSLLLSAVLLGASTATAGPTIVHIDAVRVHASPAGWVVDEVGHPTPPAPFARGDVITAIGGANAGRIGPLALIRLFNRAFSAPLQISLLRNGQTIPLTWYRSEGDPDAKTTFPPLGASLAFQAPAFMFRSTDGSLVSLEKLRGHWVLVNFWGTWCTPCRVEAPILSRLQHDYPGRLTVIGLALNDTAANLQQYNETVHPGYSLVNIGSLNSSVAVRYGVSEPVHGGSLPVSVLIRPDGQVAYVQGGGTDVPLEAEIRAQVGADPDTR